MTPKEKAKELFNKFQKPIDLLHKYPMCFDTSKQCALIAVDEIIQQWEIIDTYIADFGGKLNQSLKYWEKVKQEIEKL
jgi:hypothetical protein